MDYENFLHKDVRGMGVIDTVKKIKVILMTEKINLKYIGTYIPSSL
jgi:hypothetical protein